MGCFGRAEEGPYSADGVGRRDEEIAGRVSGEDGGGKGEDGKVDHPANDSIASKSRIRVVDAWVVTKGADVCISEHEGRASDNG